MRWLIFLWWAAAVAKGQIVPGAGSVTAQAGPVSCALTAAGATCTCTRGDGLVFTCSVWTPTLNRGADGYSYIEHNGNAVGLALHMASDGSVWWYANVKPAGGVMAQAGWTQFVAGPVTIGALDAAGRCVDSLPGFAPDTLVPIDPSKAHLDPATGLWVLDTPGANWVQTAWTPCVLQ